MNCFHKQFKALNFEHIANFGRPSLSEELAEGSAATRALLADYAQISH